MKLLEIGLKKPVKPGELAAILHRMSALSNLGEG
jgi:hypothetical protein